MGNTDPERIEKLEDAMWGNKGDPDDLGLKGDVKQISGDVALIQKDVGEIRALIKWVIVLTMGMVITAVLGLVIRVGGA